MAPHITDSPPGNESISLVSVSRNRLSQLNNDPLEPIAIIGFSLGFPQDAVTSDALWEIMMKKRNTATEFPKERMSIDAIYHPDVNRRGQVSLTIR